MIAMRCEEHKGLFAPEECPHCLKRERDQAREVLGCVMRHLNAALGTSLEAVTEPAQPIGLAMLAKEKIATQRLALERYQFEEKALKDEEKATYAVDIMGVSPGYSSKTDHALYNLALQLVGERHDKYALVDLVNWLLHEHQARVAALQEIVRVGRPFANGGSLPVQLMVKEAWKSLQATALVAADKKEGVATA